MSDHQESKSKRDIAEEEFIKRCNSLEDSVRILNREMSKIVNTLEEASGEKIT